MLAILKSRIFLGLIGLALLAVLLWFAGPYFAFADYKPLEGVVGRLIAILVLVAIWAIVMTLRQLRSSQASNKIAAEVVGQDGGGESGADSSGGGAAGGSRTPATSRAGGADAAQLRKRFEDAIEALKKSKRKGSANLYELPWYVIIGPPGSGKTTVLANSGLNFPLAQDFELRLELSELAFDLTQAFFELVALGL